MTVLVTVPILLGCLLGAGWSATAAARDRRPSNPLLIVLVAVEALVLVQLVVAVVEAVRSGTTGWMLNWTVFLLYAAFLPVALPIGVFWSSAEKSRSSTLVITIACVTVAVMTLRMLQIWDHRAIA